MDKSYDLPVYSRRNEEAVRRSAGDYHLISKNSSLPRIDQADTRNKISLYESSSVRSINSKRYNLNMSQEKVDKIRV